MPQETYDILTDSLQRCTRSEAYLDTFYSLFLARSSRARDLFQKTDMALQKRRLHKALPALLALPCHDPKSPEVARAREAHRSRHPAGQQTDYGTWVDALCDTFYRHDPRFHPELELALRERLKEALDLLNSSSKEPPSESSVT